MTAMIEVRQLSKRFGRLVAVDDLSFDVEAGRVVGFLGPNGSGKTTTLRMLLSQIRPTAGSCLVAGESYRDLRDPVRTVGAALENSALHPGRSGRDHLRVLATQARIGRDGVEELMDVVDLRAAADRRAGGYSLGMRHRLALAGALLGDPKVLVLDEPANGLDPDGVRWLREVLRGLAGDGTTVLISSHVLAEVAQTVDEVVNIGRGRLLTQSSLAELSARFGGGVRVRTPQVDALTSALRAQGLEPTEVSPDTVVVPDGEIEEIGRLAAASGIVVYELAPVDSSLEEAYVALTSSTRAIR